METALIVSLFRFLSVRPSISVLRIIILPETQILKVSSRISNLSRFHFLFLKFYVARSRFRQLEAIRTEKK